MGRGMSDYHRQAISRGFKKQLEEGYESLEKAKKYMDEAFRELHQLEAES